MTRRDPYLRRPDEDERVDATDWIGWIDDGGVYVVHAYDGVVDTDRAACGTTIPYYGSRLGETDRDPLELEIPRAADDARVCEACAEEAEP